jgi:hypothetical protein
MQPPSHRMRQGILLYKVDLIPPHPFSASRERVIEVATDRAALRYLDERKTSSQKPAGPVPSGRVNKGYSCEHRKGEVAMKLPIIVFPCQRSGRCFGLTVATFPDSCCDSCFFNPEMRGSRSIPGVPATRGIAITTPYSLIEMPPPCWKIPPNLYAP